MPVSFPNLRRPKIEQTPRFDPEAPTFDVRGKPLQKAKHWSAPESFGSRAHFNTDTDPATLDIQV
ncbi:AAEL003982-PA [Aedes aegypti]|uniref:AAEL003982-PA n=1 Tax=Aedes aegypti TaxID=7159 RepID=Q17E17_AEDAE|nr:AAEL003982-PA [Aedes aegypti]